MEILGEDFVFYSSCSENPLNAFRQGSNTIQCVFEKKKKKTDANDLIKRIISRM